MSTRSLKLWIEVDILMFSLRCYLHAYENRVVRRIVATFDRFVVKSDSLVSQFRLSFQTHFSPTIRHSLLSVCRVCAYKVCVCITRACPVLYIHCTQLLYLCRKCSSTRAHFLTQSKWSSVSKKKHTIGVLLITWHRLHRVPRMPNPPNWFIRCTHSVHRG